MTSFSIVSAIGTIPLASQPGEREPYRLMGGTGGLGLPPEYVRFQQKAGGGSSYRGSRTGPREAVLVIEVRGTSRADTETKLRTLARHLEPASRPQLVAEIPGQGRWRLGFFRTGGGEDSYGEWGDNLTEWEIDIECPNPYWVADTPVAIVVAQDPAAVVGLLPDLAELNVMASGAFGSVDLENQGDVQAPVSWRIVGPGGPTVVDVGGRGFTVEHVLDPGQVLLITRTDTGWAITEESTGTNRYPWLGPAPKFPYAPVGTVTADITLDGATPASLVSGFFNPLRKVVY